MQAFKRHMYSHNTSCNFQIVDWLCKLLNNEIPLHEIPLDKIPLDVKERGGVKVHDTLQLVYPLLMTIFDDT